MIGIDLFSGVGGMALGAARAGVDIRVAVEGQGDALLKFNWKANKQFPPVKTAELRVRCYWG